VRPNPPTPLNPPLIVQTLSFMHCTCNFIGGLSDVIIKTFSQSVSQSLVFPMATARPLAARTHYKSQLPSEAENDFGDFYTHHQFTLYVRAVIYSGHCKQITCTQPSRRSGGFRAVRGCGSRTAKEQEQGVRLYCVLTVCPTRSVAAHRWPPSNALGKFTFILNASINIVFITFRPRVVTL